MHDVRGLLRSEPQLPEDGARLLRPPRNHLRRRGQRGNARLLLQVRMDSVDVGKVVTLKGCYTGLLPLLRYTALG